MGKKLYFTHTGSVPTDSVTLYANNSKSAVSTVCGRDGTQNVEFTFTKTIYFLLSSLSLSRMMNSDVFLNIST